MNAKTDKQAAAVKVVLRIGGEPETGSHLVALLHEVAAFVDSGEKTSDGDIVGDFHFGAGQLRGVFVNPDIAANLGKQGGRAGGCVIGGVGRYLIFFENTVAALFAGD